MHDNEELSLNTKSSLGDIPPPNSGFSGTAPNKSLQITKSGVSEAESSPECNSVRLSRVGQMCIYSEL